MIEIRSILSFREIKKEAFRDIVYEWEDDIAGMEGIPIINIREMSKLKRKLHKKLACFSCNNNDFKGPVSITFITVLSDLEYILRKKNCIPILLDVGLGDVEYIAKVLKNKSIFVVTSLDFYFSLYNAHPNLKCFYMPLMISDRWKENVTKKCYDIIQPGRKNQILHEYALNFVKKYPQYNYVYSSFDGTLGEMRYYSTNGITPGIVKSRDQYMNFLQASRICLVSSPGIDNPKSWVKGMDFITPRFYEAAISNCRMVGRYTENKEFREQGVTAIVPNIRTFKEFEEILLKNLNNDTVDNNNLYNTYIDMHCTSFWWDCFKKKLFRKENDK